MTPEQRDDDESDQPPTARSGTGGAEEAASGVAIAAGLAPGFRRPPRGGWSTVRSGRVGHTADSGRTGAGGPFSSGRHGAMAGRASCAEAGGALDQTGGPGGRKRHDATPAPVLRPRRRSSPTACRRWPPTWSWSSWDPAAGARWTAARSIPWVPRPDLAWLTLDAHRGGSARTTMLRVILDPASTVRWVQTFNAAARRPGVAVGARNAASASARAAHHPRRRSPSSSWARL